MNSFADIWQIVLEKLHGELSETTINTWFDEIKSVDLQDKTFLIVCPSEFKRNMISSRYAEPIKAALRDIFSDDISIRLVSGEEEPENNKKALSLFDLDDYTFDTFVVGECNKLAHAAARAVADGASAHYNPLFIYGDSGLGKTHLIYAISHQFKKRMPNAKIVYIKGDDFLNEFIRLVRSNRGEEFRAKYRDADLFLVDDVQFVAGKEQSQNEFFHTFNSLYESGKQIVLTSDRLPTEMTLLDDRLRTRFDMGLTVDVQAPDYETRVAIIKNKAVQRGFVIDDKSADYIARNVTANVRQIEGVVNMINAQRELTKKNMSDEEIEGIVRNAVQKNNEAIPKPDAIIAEVARYYDLNEADIRGPSRARKHVNARNIAMYLIRQITGLSTTEIGKIFERDHSTAVHSLDQVDARLETDPTYSQVIKDITLNINNYMR
ncbi:MAG: chromosomal replication initiator protein DnaA [Oscillospiraceae bacterium]|nr:chromosomal replication initiator protein DnaA [Oscillospiraceae bacterium]